MESLFATVKAEADRFPSDSDAKMALFDHIVLGNFADPRDAASADRPGFLCHAPTVADHRNAPVNALGYLRVMFAVDDIDETLERLRKRGAQLVGEVVRYKDAYRPCYIRGPEGLLNGLAQELN